SAVRRSLLGPRSNRISLTSGLPFVRQRSGRESKRSTVDHPLTRFLRGKPMNENNPLVCVIDDESSIRESLSSLLRSAGLKVQAFSSAQEFLASATRDALRCLVLDVQLPGISGLDLQRELASGDAQIPIIFITGHGDIPMSVRAIKAGALEFLTKPFDDEYLLEAIREAIARHSKVGRARGSIAGDSCEGDRGTDSASRAMPDQAEIVF